MDLLTRDYHHLLYYYSTALYLYAVISSVLNPVHISTSALSLYLPFLLRSHDSSSHGFFEHIYCTSFCLTDQPGRPFAFIWYIFSKLSIFFYNLYHLLHTTYYYTFLLQIFFLSFAHILFSNETGRYQHDLFFFCIFLFFCLFPIFFSSPYPKPTGITLPVLH